MNKKLLVILIGMLVSLSTSVHAYTLPVAEHHSATTVETIEIPEGTITITEVEYFGLANGLSVNGGSSTYFYDELNANCNNGVQFVFSASGPGTVTWGIYWSSGGQSNTPYCSGSQCNYTITTSWQAYYTDAFAKVDSPQTVWGPVNAYTCR